jgi:pyruvate/2-oxoglutarate dehydrogenase complex dihydrolipoamide acyltransferase (E2) component
MTKERFQVIPFPRSRRFALDAGRLGRGKHIVHGLAEVDVTEARSFIRQHEASTGERLSFTAFFINCLGEAIQRHQVLHAYRNWRGDLLIFEDVNITTMIEADLGGRRVPVPYVLKAVNKKSYLELHQEIRTVQTMPRESQGAQFMRWFLLLPWFIRRLFYGVVLGVPQRFRNQSSPVMVTAVGMFSRGASWGITHASHTLTVALGGIAEKPGVVDGQIAVREFLHVTVSVDHDVVDGAPAARFGSDLMDLVERGYGLLDGVNEGDGKEDG